ncbi:MAG: DNA polymerase III subunit delta [Planctomyces sp.]|nr:DNA polymerase III subunit delta [Planctomyces sp.]
MHATEFLKAPGGADVPLIVVHGDELALKHAAFGAAMAAILGADGDEDLNRVRLRGPDCDWARVRDELACVSMFGDRRLVIVEDADSFITDNRSQLETYCDKPSKKSVLVLDVKSWRSNTRLAKRLDAMGLAIECTELAGPRLIAWLADSAQSQHGKQLSRDAAALIVELAGTGLGLLEQEVAKLAAYVGDRPKIGVEDVRQLVGGWKAETTWTMLDAVRDGDADTALACLHKLLVAGEAAPKLLGGAGYVFRKLAVATELSRQGRPLPVALKEAGVFPRDVDKAERYLRRIRRPRAERILARLVRADADLKGGSPLNDRLQMELFLLWLAGVETPPAVPG